MTAAAEAPAAPTGGGIWLSDEAGRRCGFDCDTCCSRVSARTADCAGSWYSHYSVSENYLLILAVAGLAAVASPIGGLLALWHKPSSLFMSLALGFAGGVLMGTISFEMIPQALSLSSLTLTVAGFVLGFLAVYGFDLFIHSGRVAGPKAEQEQKVKRYYRRHRPRGDEVTVLAGGTSTEELIEGLSIGVGTSIRPGIG